MGAITSAFNQAAGAVAGAAVAIKHTSQQKAAQEEAKIEKAAKQEEQGLLAKEQYHEASADLTKLEGESAEAGEAIKAAKKGRSDVLKLKEGDIVKDASGKDVTLTKADIKKRRKEALTEVQAAQRAFDELADRIEAKKAMMSRAETIMKRTGTWGGMR